MRIGIDLYSFIPDKNFGVGPTVYAYNLVKHIVEAESEHFFVIFTNSANSEFFPPGKNCKIIASRMPPSKGVLRVVHEQWVLPFYFYREKLDLLHFTGNVISFLLGKKAVLTVHDLMWKYYLKSDWVPPYKKNYYSRLCPLSFKLSGGIITVSHFIKNELIASCGVEHNKIFVIHEAQGAKDLKLSSSELAEFQKKYPPGFLFTVTTTWPHKNLITLLKAYVVLKKKDPKFNRKLIVVGQNRLPNREINQYLLDNALDSSSIALLGFVPDQELKYFYSQASVFIFPSLYEGFGLPLLEAMKMGLPIVASNAASLPEIGQESCLYADARSPEDFAQKIQQLLSDEKLRDEMIRRGKEREKQFSWEKLASKTIAVYEKL